MKQRPKFLQEKRGPCEGLLGKDQKEKRSEIANPLSFRCFIPIWFAISRCQHLAGTWRVLFLVINVFPKKGHERTDCVPCVQSLLPLTLTACHHSPRACLLKKKVSPEGPQGSLPPRVPPGSVSKGRERKRKVKEAASGSLDSLDFIFLAQTCVPCRPCAGGWCLSPLTSFRVN